MKRFIILLAILPVLFIGCSGNDDAESLDGTKWRAEKEFTMTELPDKPGDIPLSWPIREEYILSFTKVSVTLKVNTIEFKDGGEKKYNIEYQGSYQYEHPEISIDMEHNIILDSGRGKRDGNRLIFSEDMDEYVFVKQ